MRRRWSFWRALAVSSVLAFAGCGPPPEAHVLRTADFRFVPAPNAIGSAELPQPPSGAERRSPVTLPHRWSAQLQGSAGTGWYRVALPQTDATGTPNAMFLPRVSSNAVVYLDGEWLGDGGSFGEAVARNWNRPLYFPIAPGRFAGTDRTHTVEVGVQGMGSLHDGLGPILFGPDRALRAYHVRALALQIGVAQVATLLSAVAALLFGALWAGLRREPVYGAFALAAACFCVNSLNYHVQTPPMSYWRFEWLVNVALEWFCACFVSLVLRLLALRRPRLERAAWLYAAGVSAVGLALPGPAFDRVAPWFHLVSMAIAASCLLAIVMHRDRLSRPELVAYVITGCVMLPVMAGDLATQIGVLPSTSLRLFPLVGAVMFVGFGAALMLRFLGTYRLAQQQNLELEARVAQKRAELEEDFRRLRVLERERAVGDERERITREMHDGLGGHLIATLALAEGNDERIAEALRDALDEMRVVIHSLDPWIDDVPGLLVATRARLEPRLASRGLRLRWAIGDLPPMRLGPSTSLQVLRVVQEAITNVLKHAAARTIQVRTATGHDGRRILVEIRDDGKGFDQNFASGYGLSNMRERARRLGGELEIEPGPTGTAVRLWLPTEPTDSV